MAHIMEMPSHVADLIAAGEVVERPASVVKELVENAIDAGATAVAVEIRRGGMGLIRVSDDGCGIAPEELPTAFLRHATSKLRGAEDLGHIGTLGFRGEALAAISAVSRVDILSRQKGSGTAGSLHLEAGIPTGAVEAAGAPEGTTISVGDLFYNTPARLKFMKKDSAETTAVAGLMQHLALSHPEISFRFTKDGAESLHTPGDGKPESAVYAALGRDFARTLLPVEGRGGETAVSGFVTRPEAGRGSRSMQVFFVNGRFIKSQLLTAAVEEGYRNQLMKGRFPGCVLFVTLPVTEVDVNVHPAKTAVKFSREKEVFDAVYHTVLDALEAQCGPRPPEEQRPLPRQEFFRTMDARSWRERGGGKEEVRYGKPAEVPYGGTAAAKGRPAEASLKNPAAGERTEADIPRGKGGSVVAERGVPYRVDPAPPSGRTAEPPPHSPPPETKPAAPSLPEQKGAEEALPRTSPRSGPGLEEEARRPFVPAIPSAVSPSPRQETLPQMREESPWRIAGEVFRTYIVCESEDGCLWLIDKHAAHERVNFDRLMSAREPVMRQVLLTPAAVELGREDSGILLENLPLLEECGFACEDFGDGTVLVREVPSDMEPGDLPATLEELAEKLRRGRSLEERRENILHTVACKSAIKGGWTSDPSELAALVEKVRKGEVRYCPHGRPVAVKMSKYEIEKLFGRA